MRAFLLERLEPRLVLSVLLVDQDASGANDGTSWTNAYFDLQDGLGSANAGDDTWVAEGAYKPTSGTSRDASFNLKTSVDLYVVFSGNSANRRGRAEHASIKTRCEPHRQRLAGMHQNAFPATIQRIHPTRVCRLQVNLM
jgi:hypothetical protein